MADRKAPSPLGPDFSPGALDDRITVHEGMQTIEIDYTGLTFDTSAEVGAFYDRIEQRITETGEPLWFFLVDTTDYRIDDSAWFTYTRRGRDVQEGHSMGTLRVDRSADTAARIERTRGTDRFNPNLFASRAEAVADLSTRPSRRRTRVGHVPSFLKSEFLRRVRLNPATDIAEVDFSAMSFEHSRDVNDVFNWLEEELRATRRKWYFLYNYEGTRIQSPAWLQYSLRADALRETWSLGSVRYAAGSETERDIRQRAETREIRPNIRNTRTEALTRIDEMKAAARR
ncbi:hypothetical protein [Roseisalinus antarcticus]|uniref:Uncharacterized protein n=1 Tax=Roseisalinus antarcticus TaxID=254357 RepID=A0A1Y5SMH3_9RHOB|nr:hypothetical protein [Roseisalinus antarcticus]SLN43738.1 hypothetical protein ROA7023_01795 [Roseisalinus antarcticus]